MLRQLRALAICEDFIHFAERQLEGPPAKTALELLPRCVHRPQSRVERDPHNRSRCVTVDVQAVFSRPGNFEFVGCDWSQQNRLAHRQIVAGGGVPGQFDFEPSSLASHLRDGVRGKGIAGNYAVEFLRSEDKVRARSLRRQLGETGEKGVPGRFRGASTSTTRTT
jgi:hypothetical protein